MSALPSPEIIRIAALRSIVERAIPIIQGERDALWDSHVSPTSGVLVILDEGDRRASRQIQKMDRWLAAARANLLREPKA